MPRNMITSDMGTEIVKAARCKRPVSGLTHDFYRYPARFSPAFARAVIRAFTQKGDAVIDPFMGGGTSLVEACALGRQAAGCDVSSLAVFLAKVKTGVYSEDELRAARGWAFEIADSVKVHDPPARARKWVRAGYQRNINTRRTWPIRKALELALSRLDDLSAKKERDLARCILLRTGQWALDSRKTIPSVTEFRQQLAVHAEDMVQGAAQFSAAVEASKAAEECNTQEAALCIQGCAASVDGDQRLSSVCPPRLILTSPPYPGVHVLYHRWQVEGRRETAAPFWIANCMDGEGEAYYTMGGRHQSGIDGYFERLGAIFRSLARVSGDATTLVQLLGFSEPDWQLDRYLHTLASAGFRELRLAASAGGSDGRLWRQVPNRKWYALQRADAPSSSEVVLFHRLRRC